jgi:branched-chain amino acid transport system permease protein
MYAFCYLGSVEPDGFSLEMSFKILFMIIIGGVGSIMGSFLGAAFILLLPIFLDIALPFFAGLFGLPFSSATVSHIQITVFGALIMFFLIVEPHGLARLWQIAKEKAAFVAVPTLRADTI